MTNTSALATQGLDSLSSEQVELLKMLIERKSSEAQRIRPVPRDPDATVVRLPTSWAQQRLWFIDQLDGGSTAYHIPWTIRLRGPLHYHALQQALDALVQRHEALRTVFDAANGDPIQLIAASGRFPLRIVDLSNHEPDRGEALRRQHQLEEAYQSFDLRQGPLLRGRLLRLAPEEHVLSITMHHIVSDGWSMDIFVRELAQLYTAYRDGLPASLPPLPIQYADYAQWQRRMQAEEGLMRQLSYWRERLAGAPAELELPTDWPRPATQSHRGDSVAIHLNAHSSARLKALAQRHEMTLFMVLYTAWAVLLSRLSGQPEVLIGTPVANRRRPELEGLIGFFVNTVVLRTEVSDEVSVGALLDQVKATTLAAYDHQDVPFEQVVEAVQPQRSLGRNPLFQVMFSLQSAPTSELRLPQLTLLVQEEVYDAAKFDLLLALQDRGDHIVGTLNYAKDLFSRQTVERWTECLMVLLDALPGASAIRASDLPLLTAQERERIVVSFNATQAPLPEGQLVHQLFEEQARRTPHATAVVDEFRNVLTYAQLNADANRLAHHLRQRGMQVGELVPISLPRSLRMLIAQLAVLKCGGAYVPIDPSMPLERGATIVRDCGARRIIADGEGELASQIDWLQRVDVASVLEADRALPDSDLALSLHTPPPAYVMYTSGSTGVPKGVIVSHRAVIRLVINNGYAQIDATDCIAHCSNTSFDASTFEIWGALLNGARVLIVPQSVALDAALFAETLRSGGVTAMFLTTALFNQYALAAPEMFAPLKYLLFGGEESDVHAVANVLRHGRPAHLLHAYGPTEATTFATWYPVHALTGEERRIPIGRPIGNTQVYLLDRRQQPVPIGVAGEIHIGGVGVADGYLNRDELTREKFIPDPFSSEPAARLYKTGDFGRWLPEGFIEFLGRNDHQVKLRGFRIELGEIEAQLERHEHVTAAIVIAREDTPGQKCLVAYVTPGADSEPAVEDLRAHVRSVLPEYMVPAAFVVLPSLPLTPNGKLDRRALPAPALDAYSSREYQAPRGSVETTLAQIWQELLRVERVGRNGDFFELGGHSLLATRVISRIREVLKVDLPLKVLFDASTIERLAERIGSETQRSNNLTQELRSQIDEMNEAEVLARIAELEQQLSTTE